jgi:hypothetical protein
MVRTPAKNETDLSRNDATRIMKRVDIKSKEKTDAEEIFTREKERETRCDPLSRL